MGSSFKEEAAERKNTTWDRVKDSPWVFLILLPIMCAADSAFRQGRDVIDIALAMMHLGIWGLISDIFEPGPITPLFVAYLANGALGVSIAIAHAAGMEDWQNGLFMMGVGALVVCAGLSVALRWRARR